MNQHLAVTAGAFALAFIYSSRDFRADWDYTLGGVVTGLVVVGGWYVSGVLGHVAEDPNTLQEAFVATNSGRMESFSFVSPMAYTLDYLMLWTDKSKIITYGIASGIGVIAGSAAYALAKRTASTALNVALLAPVAAASSDGRSWLVGRAMTAFSSTPTRNAPRMPRSVI